VLGVNIASGGLSGLVSEAASSLAKLRWGTLAYVFGAAESASTLTTYQAQMVLDGGTEIRCAALSVLVANGRFAGGGWNVASPADLEDGLLDLILIPAGPLVELAGVAADLLAGDYLDSGLVEHHRVAAVELSSQPIMPFRIDGEPLTGDTLTFSVRPACLRVFVGPDYFSRETD
jgi:diacylglycerol kinase (ATP)